MLAVDVQRAVFDRDRVGADIVHRAERSHLAGAGVERGAVAPGLGDAFLWDTERTRVIVHMIDICPPEGSPTPSESYEIIRSELAGYSSDLAARPEIVVANKMDLTGADEALAELQEHLDKPVLAISGAAGSGLRELTEAMWTFAEAARELDAPLERPPLRFEGVESDTTD